jgi:hypothetical protein
MPTPTLPQAEVIETLGEQWGQALQPAGCRVCDQVHLVDAASIGKPCPNCGRGKLEAQSARMRPETPELVIPFRKNHEDFRLSLEQFVRGVWITPDDMTTEKMLARAMPVFVPMWLVDGTVDGDWQAECGYDYQVESTRQNYANGQWVEQKVIETRQKWEPRMGKIQRRYDNITVPAMSDQERLTAWMGAYNIRQSVSYDIQKVAKACLRVPDLPPEDAWNQAKGGLDMAAGLECQQAAGAQHIRNVIIHADYQQLNWTQLLLPMLVTWYQDDTGMAHPVYINGQSGKAGGVRMASQRKGWRITGIIGAMAVAILLFAGVLALVGTVVPPMLAVAGFVALAALLIGVTAIVPAVWPWQWNRKQKAEKFGR